MTVFQVILRLWCASPTMTCILGNQNLDPACYKHSKQMTLFQVRIVEIFALDKSVPIPA